MLSQLFSRFLAFERGFDSTPSNSSLLLIVPSQLLLCSFVRSPSLAQSLQQALSSDRYTLNTTSLVPEFFDQVEQQKVSLDCLIVEFDPSLFSVVEQMHKQGTILPVVIFGKESQEAATLTNPLFHEAEIFVPNWELQQIVPSINQAIAQFLELAPTYRHPTLSNTNLSTTSTPQTFLLQKQHRLMEKLKERLGYLGVYYKRNPQYFLRYLSPTERQQLLEKLRLEYRQIILHYFSQDEELNQKIDSFIDQLFFADLPVSQLVEIHMELMDEFSKQLKIEGRSEDILLDYRLTLIDTIAHLCEMYRRCLPKEL